MAARKYIQYLFFILWYSFVGSMLGFLCQFVWIKILISGPQWGEVNFIIITLTMLGSGWPLSTLVPVFLVKHFSLVLSLSSNWSRVAAILGIMLTFTSYIIGGIRIYSYYAPFDAWLLRYDPLFFGEQFALVFFIVGLLFSGANGYVLWKNFDVKYLW